MCDRCKRPVSVCYCHTITTVHNNWPVWIIQDKSEIHHPLGTARIAELSLNNLEMISTKNKNLLNLFLKKIEEKRPMLVYPGNDAHSMQDMPIDMTSPLLFLDGSWRKTKKMLYDYPQISALPKLSLSPDFISRYKIRKEPNTQSISTIEAIVHTLSYLENNPQKYQPMLSTMDWIIEKQIEFIGEETYKKNYQKR